MVKLVAIILGGGGQDVLLKEQQGTIAHRPFDRHGKLPVGGHQEQQQADQRQLQPQGMGGGRR